MIDSLVGKIPHLGSVQVKFTSRSTTEKESQPSDGLLDGDPQNDAPQIDDQLDDNVPGLST